MEDEHAVRRVNRYRRLAGGVGIGLASMFLLVFAQFPALARALPNLDRWLQLRAVLIELASLVAIYSTASWGLAALSMHVVDKAAIDRGQLTVWERDESILIPLPDVLGIQLVSDQFMLSGALTLLPSYAPRPAAAIRLRCRRLQPAFLLVGDGVQAFIAAARRAGLSVEDRAGGASAPVEHAHPADSAPDKVDSG